MECSFMATLHLRPGRTMEARKEALANGRPAKDRLQADEDWL